MTAEAALVEAFGVDLGVDRKVPTGTASFKTRKGANEYFLSLPFPVAWDDPLQMEKQIDGAFNLITAAVLTNAGIPWELSPEGRPVAQLPAEQPKAIETASAVAPAVQRSTQGNSKFKTLGVNSQGEEVALNPQGQHGPYVKAGKTFVTIPASVSVEKVTLEMANEWIATKRARLAASGQF